MRRRADQDGNTAAPGPSRRHALQAIGLASAWTSAWAASPVRAALLATETAAAPRLVDELISRMTLEEKAGQLTLMASAWGGAKAAGLNPPGAGATFDQQIADAVAGKLTGVFNGNGAEMASQMQHAVMQRSRLKIPLMFAADVIHGYRTVFPIPLGEAASFDPQLAMRTARVAAYEASGAGIDWTFAPMVDIGRDQRWGRVVEGAGEDVLLGELFAAARTRGFQGRSLSDDDAVLACPKHFAAYGAVEGGLDYNTVDISERTLRQVYLRPFKAAFDAGALSTMAAFSEISGVPSTGNHWLLTDLLRDEWGFSGIVVSDYTADEEMIAHGFAADGREAARIALTAGVDMSMQSDLYRLHLPGLVRDGRVPQALLDRSVRRVLAMKARLGLFDDPFRRIDIRREKARSRLPASLKLARESAARSIVMLKNDGAILPLAKSARIAAVGPFASGQHDLIGGWCVYGDDAQAVDLVTGLRNAGGIATATAGSGVETPLPGGIEAAVAAAHAADVVLLAIGEGEDMSGEAQSRTEIVVPAPQQALAEAVVATGKPVVVLLKNGRALALSGAVAAAPAILVTWFLGSESGNAIADVVYGAIGPSGRLPVSFPFSAGQEPYYYDHMSTGRPQPPGPRLPYKAQYREAPNAAQWPFGHGLTYGRIGYHDLAIGDGGKLAWDGALEVSTQVTNSGERAAEELVQLYVHDRVASITQPVRELLAFRKVVLAPGASATVRFTLRRSDLEFIGLSLKPTVEPGLFDLWIAPSAQAEGVAGQFELVGSAS